MNEGQKRAVIYTRISRDDSGEGVANDRQRQACQSLADARGYHVVAIEEDVSISAYSGKERPAWSNVLAMVEAGSVDLILAYQLDRVTRNMRDLTDLMDLAKKTGVGLLTASGDIDLTTEQGRMLANIITSVSQFEVERKGSRQKAANQQRAAQGEPWRSGFRCFGYTLDGELIPAEAERVRTAASDALDGVSMREICRQWNDAGLKSVHAERGGRDTGWTARGIKNLLVNPRLAGYVTYKGERMGKGNWEPILTDEHHALLVATLTDDGRRTNRTTAGRKPTYLLSTIATCAKCGATVGGRMSNGHPAYSCQPANHVSTRRELADEYVIRVFEAAVRAYGPMHLGPKLAATASVSLADIEAMDEQRKTLTELFMAGHLSGDSYTESMKELSERERNLGESIRGERPALIRASEGADEYLDEFESASMDARRDALDRLLKITLNPIGQGRRNVPIEDQVEIWVKHESGELLSPADLLAEAK